MSEQVMSQQQVDIVDRESIPKDARSAALVPSNGADDSRLTMEALGFIVPVATPEQLRKAFAERQRLFAAILDPNDYLWTVSYPDTIKTGSGPITVTKNYIARTREEAEERAGALKGQASGKPKKNGIVKLARALGITATIIESAGLPGDPHATYAYVRYEALHAGTGLREIGVGFCDGSERGGRISKHDIIATADTRAYNRAVLRLSGFGDISAEELVASDDVLPAQHVPEPASLKPFADLPPIDSDDVLTACRTWAEAVAKRTGERFEPAAKQDTRSARELRAAARRGDTKAALKLGSQGLRWEGSAHDGPGHMLFTVEREPVTPDEIMAAAYARSGDRDAAPTTAATTAPVATAPESKGWDLSGSGSQKDDVKPVPAPSVPSQTAPPAAPATPAPATEPEPETFDVPAPHPSAETITTKQAKNVSSALMEMAGGDKTKAREWLKKHCHVDSAIHLRMNQYEPAMNVLGKLNESKKG